MIYIKNYWKLDEDMDDEFKTNVFVSGVVKSVEEVKKDDLNFLKVNLNIYDEKSGGIDSKTKAILLRTSVPPLSNDEFEIPFEIDELCVFKGVQKSKNTFIGTNGKICDGVNDLGEFNSDNQNFFSIDKIDNKIWGEISWYIDDVKRINYSQHKKNIEKEIHNAIDWFECRLPLKKINQNLESVENKNLDAIEQLQSIKDLNVSRREFQQIVDEITKDLKESNKLLKTIVGQPINVEYDKVNNITKNKKNERER